MVAASLKKTIDLRLFLHSNYASGSGHNSIKLSSSPVFLLFGLKSETLLRYPA